MVKWDVSRRELLTESREKAKAYQNFVYESKIVQHKKARMRQNRVIEVKEEEEASDEEDHDARK